MNQTQRTKLVEAVVEALELRAEDRADHLERLRASNAELGDQVAQLLAQHERSLTALPTPPEEGTIPAGLDPEQDPLIGQTLGAFQLLRLIEAGGMGRVYEARQKSPDRRVAVKVLAQRYLRGSTMRRFAQEAEVLGSLEDPSICRIYASGSAKLGTELVPYIAMEYVDGSPLLQAVAGLGLNERLALLAEVCDAVEYAHQKGVIHRDLKPGNIMVTKPADSGTGDRKGRIKVLDFGVAKVLADAVVGQSLRTQTGHIIGTLHYMSPEQAAGSLNVDARSDVYSLGVILFELVSERLPRELPSTQPGVAAAVLTLEEPVLLGSINPAWRGDLEHVAAKALDRDPLHRYPSAEALARDLRSFVAGEAVSVRGSTRIQAVRRFHRKHRGQFRAAGTVLLALAMVILSLYWRSPRTTEATAADRARVAFDRYVASVQAAHAAIRADDTAAAQLSLAETDVNLRKWEWKYLAGLADQAQQVWQFSRLGGAPTLAVMESGDRKKLAVLTRTHTLSVDIVSQRIIRSEARDGTSSIALAQPGGSLVAIIRQDTLLVHDCAGGPLERAWTGMPATSVAWSADGSGLAVGSMTGSATVLRADTGAPQRTIRYGGKRIDALAFLDADRLAASLEDGAIAIDGAPVATLGTGRRAVAMSASGDAMAIVGSWGVQVRKGSDLAETVKLQDADSAGRCVSLSADAQWLAAGTGAFVCIWNATTGERIARLRGHAGNVTSVAFSADSEFVWSTGEDGAVRRWKVERHVDVERYSDHHAQFNVLCGPTELVGFFDQDRSTFQIQGAADDMPLATLPNVHARPWRFGITADHKYAILAGLLPGNVLSVRNAETGTEIAARPGFEQEDHVLCVDSSHNRLALAGNSGVVRFFSIPDLTPLGEFREPAKVDGAVLSPDGERIATIYWPSGLRVRRVSDGAILADCDTRGGMPIYPVFSDDGRYIASLNYKELNLNLWDSLTGKLVRRVLVEHPMYLVKLGASGRLAVGSLGGGVRIFAFDIPEGEPWSPLLTLRDTFDDIHALAADDAGIVAWTPSHPLYWWRVRPTPQSIDVR